MKNRHTQLSILVVKEYAQILYRYYRGGKANANEITTALAQYMKALGLPRPILLLTVAAYLTLL